MKRIVSVIAMLALLTGCGGAAPAAAGGETAIVLSDAGITVNGGGETKTVYTSRDIVYYEDRDFYASGNPYGEGGEGDKHAAEEAEAHRVVNITAPGTYRVSGTLSAGQIRVDLGEEAYEDKSAVVKLILDGADISCTVAPAILFLNVYECDGDWDADTASARVDTKDAGAVLVLEGENRVSGSYVAKIFKDKDGEKKLWKQDGAIYSYMSLNVEGTGKLDLTAENEGLDTELHLTVNGGNLSIRSGNDGINTNEDGVSVTAINGGTVRILAGLGGEGDGIDSNGWLVINGGTVVSSAHPAADAGLDSDLGSFIHGGTVIALGSTMDWAESDSGQATMNLQFARQQTGALKVTREDGTEVFAYDPAGDPLMADADRTFRGAVISCADLQVGEAYYVYADGVRMLYTGTDVGGFGGARPPEFAGEPPEGFDPGAFEGGMPPAPEDGRGGPPGGMPEEFPGDFDGARPESPPEGEESTVFYLADKVNAFSGLRAAE